ncbi:MAG TPA: SIS domain-containing protein [Candidatus Paceibacterota bacterium]|nr:SIS domain-containing protein [Candidatus Paceibacterota bacterium]
MNKDFIQKYLEETKEIAESINSEDVSKFIDILFDAWKSGKKIITMGNGGSASTASHFAGDLAKTIVNPSSEKEISPTKGFKAICLNDNPANFTAWVNDCGWERVYAGQLNTLLEEGDIILLVSVHGGSGWSGNLIQAMELAKQRNAKILGLSGFDGGKLKEIADACIVVTKPSTPHVEGFHSVLQHLIIFRLKEMIEEYSKNESISKLEEAAKQCSDEILKSKIKELIERAQQK